MGVYILSWSLNREVNRTGEDVTYEFQTLMRVVKNVFSPYEAGEAIADSFADSELAKDGWKLIGPPSAIHVTQEVADTWTAYIDPPPANDVKKPPYLRPVDDR